MSSERPRPYWMRRDPWDTSSHFFLLSENMLDVLRRPPEATDLTEKEKAVLRLAIKLLKMAEIRNQPVVKSSRELQESGEPSLVEGIEAYRQIKAAMGNPEDNFVNKMLADGLEILEWLYRSVPLKDIPPGKVQKVKNFFESASFEMFQRKKMKIGLR